MLDTPLLLLWESWPPYVPSLATRGGQEVWETPPEAQQPRDHAQHPHQPRAHLRHWGQSHLSIDVPELGKHAERRSCGLPSITFIKVPIALACSGFDAKISCVEGAEHRLDLASQLLLDAPVRHGKIVYEFCTFCENSTSSFWRFWLSGHG